MTAGALAVAASAGATALGPATFIQGHMASGTAMGGGLTMSTVLSSAAIKAAAVGAVSGLAGAGLTEGVTAPYLGARSRCEGITPPSGEAQKFIYDRTVAKLDTPTVVGSGVLAGSQGLYGTSCAPGEALSKCADFGVASNKYTSARTRRHVQLFVPQESAMQRP